MNTKEEAKAAAMEIINQLGGGRFIAMTGAKMFVYDHEKPANVSFKFMGSRKATHVMIELNAMDTYTVTFYRIRADKITTVKEWTGIYNDMLQSIFTETTGLNTSLGTMGR